MEVVVVVLIVNVIKINDFCEQIRDLLSRLTIRFPTKPRASPVCEMQL